MIICDDKGDFEMWKYFMHGILVKCDEQWDAARNIGKSQFISNVTNIPYVEFVCY